MSSKIQALRERRSALAKELRNSLDQNPGKLWSAEHQKTYDTGLDDIALIDAEIDRLQKVMDLDAEQQFTEAVNAAGGKPGESQEKAAYTQWLRDPNKLSGELAIIVRNVLSTGVGSEGGFTVPSEISSQLIDAMKDFSGVRQVAEVFTTAQGNPLSYPGSDGTAEVGELIAENVTATAADPVFTTVALNVYKYSSKIVAVPLELLQDSSIDIEAFVRKRLAERIGRITNTHFTVGTGTGQPRGVVVGSTLGKTGTTGQTITVISDDLVDLIHALNVAYRQQGRARFMMADLSFAKVRKLKDSQNRPIFIPGWDGLGKGMPDEILGYPVQVNDDVAVMAANAKSILFGDFSYYKVRDAMAFSLFRFADSAYVKLGQIGFLAWHRSGGNLVDSKAVFHYANSAT
jgi:HK97 family phage major capsid protein